jgi:hypothetical protein
MISVGGFVELDGRKRFDANENFFSKIFESE